MVNEVFIEADLLKLTLATAATLAALATISMGAAGCDGLPPGPSGVVTAVPDGDTVLLDTGQQIRLIGLQAPKLALGRDNIEPWPKAAEAQAALQQLTLHKTVRLAYGGQERDRYGRTLAQLFIVGDGDGDGDGGAVWAQLAMIEAGWARVYSFADNRACLVELLAAEGRARSAGLGIWRDPYYSLRAADRPDQILARAGHFELVQGRVLAAAAAGNRIYLNFGRLWKQDFTAVIEAPALKLFAGQKRDPLLLAGAMVRIRGWVDDRDGPRIAVTHPEQIEVLATR